jgi:tetratricopeptide (TPR) repeat protein
VELHSHIGEALEQRYGAAAEAHAAELAYHFAEAATTSSRQKLARYSLLAGEQALRADKPQEALGHFERALAAREGATSPAGLGQHMDADTAALLFGLGRAQAATLPRHRLGEAVASLRRAFDYYHQARDVDRAVAVAEYLFYPPVGHHREVVQLIERALGLVREQPDAYPSSYREGRLRSRLGMVKGMVEGGDYATAQEDFHQALAIARRLGDAALEMRTLAWSARVDRFHLNFNGCLQKSYRVIELARRVNEPLAELQARRLAANVLTYRGDLAAAGSHASAMLELAERLGDHYWLVHCPYRQRKAGPAPGPLAGRPGVQRPGSGLISPGPAAAGPSGPAGVRAGQ